MEIGLLGTGALGQAFCRRLVVLGQPPVVFDRSPEALAAASDLGGLPAGSAAEVAERADVLFTILPYAENVEEALFGRAGIGSADNPPATVIEASTIDPRQELAFADRLAARGVGLLDLGVAASPKLISEGKGGALVGGTGETYRAYETLLQRLFENGRVVLVGGVGAAKAVKLVNNMVGAVQVAALVEGFELARQLGIDAHALYEGLEVGMASCWALRVRPPAPGLVPGSPADLDFAADYPLDYMVKDLDYFRSAAREMGAAAPVAGVVRDMYGLASLAGLGSLDFAALALLPQRLRELGEGEQGTLGDLR